MMRLSSLFLLVGVILCAEEFIISYQAKMENDLLEGEEYKVSKVLYPRGVEGLKSGEFKLMRVCEILNIENEDSVFRSLKKNQEQVLDCLYMSGTQIYDEAMAKNLQARTRTILKIPPKRVLANVQNGVIELKVLEKR